LLAVYTLVWHFIGPLRRMTGFFFWFFSFFDCLKVVESLTACIISNPAPVCCHRNHEVVRATLSSCVCV
jgi:hypothetical protein